MCFLFLNKEKSKRDTLCATMVAKRFLFCRKSRHRYCVFELRRNNFSSDDRVIRLLAPDDVRPNCPSSVWRSDDWRKKRRLAASRVVNSQSPSLTRVCRSRGGNSSNSLMCPIIRGTPARFTARTGNDPTSSTSSAVISCVRGRVSLSISR